MTATDADTSLDLSALTEINAGFNDNDTSFHETIHKITSSGGATIDLSAVETITGPVQPDDRIEINTTGGTIDLSSLQLITSAGSGLIRFTLSDGGRTIFGDLSADAGADVKVSLNSADSHVDVEGSVILSSNIRLLAPQGGKLTIAGDFLSTQTNEDLEVLGAAVVQFDGSGTEQDPQVLEVGGLDVGLDVQFIPEDEGNFGFGQMVVGQPDQATTVRLQNLSDNNEGCEALYLWGDQRGGTENPGLVIHEGSTLILDEFNLYVYDGANWQYINELFDPPKVTEITYEPGGGIIRLGARPCPYDLDCDGMVGPSDLAILLGNWGPCPPEGDCPADIDGSGSVGPFDLALLLGFWGPCE